MEKCSKEAVLHDYVTYTLKKSWTFNRMTDDEKKRCLYMFLSAPTVYAVKGSYETRVSICSALYCAFLAGVGYDGPNWRETDPEAPKF